MSQLIARRYAKALIQSTSKQTDWELIESDLKSLSEGYLNTPLLQLFENPVFHPEERLAFSKLLGLNSLTQRCLELLIERNRTTILPDLERSYTRELDIKLGRVRAQITTARALDPEQLVEVTGALFKRIGKEVIPETIVSPAVLGGVRAQIGGLVFDSTLQSQFSQLRRDLCN
ncbi:MAG: ATP synthase F1 subunit delta [Myxococcaceae bacterium]